MENEKIHFDIIQHVGVLSAGNRGWQKEINVISWNNRPAKADIRDWNETHDRMGKGVTLNKEELGKLVDLAQIIDNI